MGKWWESKQAAWGEILLSLAVGGLATYLSPVIGIPIFAVLLGLGIWLVVRAYSNKRNDKTQLTSEIIGDRTKNNKVKIVSNKESLGIRLEKYLDRIPIEIEKLGNEAGQYPLSNYEKNYLKRISDYSSMRKRYRDKNEAIFVAIGMYFKVNPRLTQLEKTDTKTRDLLK